MEYSSCVPCDPGATTGQKSYLFNKISTLKKTCSDYAATSKTYVSKTQHILWTSCPWKRWNKTTNPPIARIMRKELFIDLVSADITDIKADAIVNSVGGRLDLSTGKLSKALSEKAGPKLQESLTKKKGIGEGKMITTAGYNLNCKHIYHCNLPSAMGKQNSIQLLQKMISECLTQATSDKCNSIAIPALGCGELKYHPHDVIAAMVSKIICCSFMPDDKDAKQPSDCEAPKSSGCDSSTVRHVMIVVHQEDTTVIEAFKNYFMEHNKPRGAKKEGVLPTPPTPKKAERAVTISFPMAWSSTQTNYEEIALTPIAYEYRSLVDTFKVKMPNAKVIEVIRVQNRHLFVQFEYQKLQASHSFRDTEDLTRHLWHGTNSSAVRQITKNNFNRSYAGKNGTAHGHGCYFSTTSKYSDDYAAKGSPGDKWMIRAEVITGRYCVGRSNMRTVPEGYHSVVNQTNQQPTIFVIFNDCAAYPEYIIRYR